MLCGVFHIHVNCVSSNNFYYLFKLCFLYFPKPSFVVKELGKKRGHRGLQDLSDFFLWGFVFATSAQSNNINKADAILRILPNMQLLSHFNYHVFKNHNRHRLGQLSFVRTKK